MCEYKISTIRVKRFSICEYIRKKYFSEMIIRKLSKGDDKYQFYLYHSLSCMIFHVKKIYSWLMIEEILEKRDDASRVSSFRYLSCGNISLSRSSVFNDTLILLNR